MIEDFDERSALVLSIDAIALMRLMSLRSGKNRVVEIKISEMTGRRERSANGPVGGMFSRVNV
jgi:hypothetical protein